MKALKPNLFIVGEQKSGTSALHALLKQHPQIFMSEDKEPVFFATDLHRESDAHHGREVFYQYRTEAEYLKLFAGVAKEKFIGESSTTYLCSGEAARNIREFAQDARIVVMFREPLSYLISLHTQLIKETGEDEEDFIRALALEQDRRLGVRLPKNIRAPKLCFYRERIRYLDNFLRFAELFPKDHIHVIPFEEFAESNQSVFEGVLRFLGVDEYPGVQYRRVNEAASPKFMPLYRVFHNPRFKRSILSVTGPGAQNTIKRVFNRFFLEKRVRPMMSEEVKLELMADFKPEVIRLNDYLNSRGFIDQDLVCFWGYDKV